MMKRGSGCVSCVIDGPRKGFITGSSFLLVPVLYLASIILHTTTLLTSKPLLFPLSLARASHLDPMTASVITSRKLEVLNDKIKAKPISWEGYSRAGLISQSDVALVQKVASTNANKGATSKSSGSELDADKEGATYAALYVKLLTNLNRNDTIAYVLYLVGDMIAGQSCDGLLVSR